MESSCLEKNFGWPFRPLNPARIRDLDQAAIEGSRVPGLLLMDRASSELASLSQRLFARPLIHGVRILAGRGNNGGDAFGLARHLACRGVSVKVFAIGDGRDTARSDAWQNRSLSGRRNPDLGSLQDLRPLLDACDRFHGVWVDGLLGTGFHGSLRAPLDELIPALNRRQEAVLAIDVPSGLDATTGQACPDAVRASVTGTLGASKTGFETVSARPYLGHVVILEIGWPTRVLELARSAQG